MASLTRITSANDLDLVPSAFPVVAMGEDQARVAPNPPLQNCTMGAVMWSAGGPGANIDLAKRKLGAMAPICGQSCIMNNEGRMGAMGMQLGLAGWWQPPSRRKRRRGHRQGHPRPKASRQRRRRRGQAPRSRTTSTFWPWAPRQHRGCTAYGGSSVLIILWGVVRYFQEYMD